MHPIQPSKPLNELQQIVVHVPGRYRMTEHIAIARYEDSGFQVIGSPDYDFPVYSGTTAVRTACDYRAGLTVRGNLLIQGQKIKPEAYLAIWRAVTPVSLEDLPHRCGIKLKALLDLDLAAESAKKWDYFRDDAALRSFREYCAAYQIGSSSQAEVAIDTLQSFVDLATFKENRARETDGNYEALSRIHLAAYACTIEAPVAPCFQSIPFQLELV